MKKAYKQHWQNFEPEKLAHKICAKNAHNRAKTSKNAKKCTKKAKTFKKPSEKKNQNLVKYFMHFQEQERKAYGMTG